MIKFRFALFSVWGLVLLSVAQGSDENKYRSLPWKSMDKTGKIEVVDGHRIAVIEVQPGAETGRHLMVASLSVEPFIDKHFAVSIRARWMEVSRPPEKWNGVKFMFNYTGSDGQRHWIHPTQLHGNRSWTELSNRIDLPDEASNGQIALGLENCSGRVEFDLDSLKLVEIETEIVNADYQVSYPERIANGPRLRGVMSPQVPLTEDDFKTLKEWNANLIRFQITRHFNQRNTDLDLVDYEQWFDARLDDLERTLVLAQSYGIKVVVDLHTPPGGWTDNGMRIFEEKKYFDHYVEAWRKIARRFKGNSSIWAYDLLNEPLQKAGAPYDYWIVQKTAAEAVRAIDPEVTLMIESNRSASATTYKYLSPLAMDNVIYQIHLYYPSAFTHQGVGGSKKTNQTYPGMIAGVNINKEKIRKRLQPARDFQLEHQAKIYVGEFSAIAWAPGADRYLADCISIFEEYGWDWSYHAFREWKGWSVEHEGESIETMRPSSNNPRKQVLLEAFKRNER